MVDVRGCINNIVSCFFVYERTLIFGFHLKFGEQEKIYTHLLRITQIPCTCLPRLTPEIRSFIYVLLENHSRIYILVHHRIKVYT